MMSHFEFLLPRLEFRNVADEFQASVHGGHDFGHGKDISAVEHSIHTYKQF